MRSRSSSLGRLSIRARALVALAAFAGAIALVASAFAAGGPVKVNGHKLYVECVGTGGPTVVFENGLGDSHDEWDAVVQASTETGVRLCSYDRYGNGASAKPRKPTDRTLLQVVSDEHAMLRAVKAELPVVVVGHSMGGLIARYYANRYSRDVGGMVLIESAPDDWDVYTKTPVYSEGTGLKIAPASTALRKSVIEDDVDWGVLGIESSLAGPVAETHDLLYDLPISITAQTVIPIKHCLVGIERVPLESIRLVRSHPAAIEACREFLSRMPQATTIAAPTTSGAAQQVASHKDPTEVAIASERAARMEGLHILQEDIGDHPEAFTRFVAVATHTRLDRRDDQEWRMAFSFVTDHRPGSLFRALEPFARHSIDLAQLVSRPIPRTPWVYRFDAVLAGYPLDPLVNETLHEVIGLTRELRVFGSYPA